MAFDQKRVLDRLDVLSRKAEALSQISAAARCEELIGKHRGMFVDHTALLWDLDPDKMTPTQLDKIGEHLIRMAGIDETKVAEAKRRLAAGEDVTVVDAECRDVTAD